MKEFRFYQDTLCEVWIRTAFSVQAETEDEAKAKAIEFKNVELKEEDLEDDDIEVLSSEWIGGTEGIVEPNENTHSIEILDDNVNVIATNNPIRIFRKYERVFCCTYEEKTHGYGFVKKDTIINNPNDKVMVIMDNGDMVAHNNEDVYTYPCNPENITRCRRCGKPLFVEHNNDLDYPFYCPECDENYYHIEV